MINEYDIFSLASTRVFSTLALYGLNSVYFFSIVLRLKNLQNLWIIIFYVLNNALFYTQLVSSFLLQKDSYYVFFLFFSSGKFWNLSPAFLLHFAVFFFRKILISFMFSFMKLFFVFLISVNCHFYI